MANTREVARPKGRPRKSEPGAAVMTWLRAKEYDRLIEIANRREQSVSSLVRQILIAKTK